MTEVASASVHASAVLVANRAVLIRGAFRGRQVAAGRSISSRRASGQLPKAVLVGDDRVHLDTAYGEIVVGRRANWPG